MNQHVIDYQSFLFIEWIGNGVSGFWSENKEVK
jgi:hypothetical protein